MTYLNSTDSTPEKQPNNLPSNEPRTFSHAQRLALYEAAGGKCQICGKPLGAHWHADHIQPYSKQGATDVINGQALCQECNLKKGNKTEIRYRTWQDEQYAAFIQHPGKWFTLVVTPGGGKTIAMLRNANFSLQTKETNFLIVVVPTEALKPQWKSKARELYGIRLKSEFTGFVTDDFDGVIVTYQQIAGNVGRDAIRALHRGRNIFVILDEPHHMAEGKSWGDHAVRALGLAVRGVLGTGTPFRSDDYQIPFAVYDETGELTAHYEYNYDDALIDQVVRALFFRKTDAQATWYSYTDEIITASFYDEVDKRQVSERLNATIAANSEFCKNVLKQAYSEIIHLRNTEQPNAKMLVIGKDTMHISMLAEVYKQITGDTPLLVSSFEDHGDKNDIAEFRNDNRIAIFAVDMVSEGVDIPPLRSLVYLTNVTAPLYFYQAIGRVVRVEPGRELYNGYVYLPSDPRLLELAHKVKERRMHVLKNFPQVCPRCGENPCVCTQPPPPPPPQPSLFESISAIPVLDGGVYDEQVYSELELNMAAEWIKQNGYRIPVEEAAKIIRKSQIGQTSIPLPVEAPHSQRLEPDPEEVLNVLRKTANRKAYKLSQLKNCTVQNIHSEWVFQHGGKWQNEETIDGLKRKIQWLERQINSMNRGA